MDDKWLLAFMEATKNIGELNGALASVRQTMESYGVDLKENTLALQDAKLCMSSLGIEVANIKKTAKCLSGGTCPTGVIQLPQPNDGKQSEDITSEDLATTWKVAYKSAQWARANWHSLAFVLSPFMGYIGTAIYIHWT